MSNTGETTGGMLQRQQVTISRYRTALEKIVYDGEQSCSPDAIYLSDIAREALEGGK